jgi:hypothetical protein
MQKSKLLRRGDGVDRKGLFRSISLVHNRGMKTTKSTKSSTMGGTGNVTLAAFLEHGQRAQEAVNRVIEAQRVIEAARATHPNLLAYARTNGLADCEIADLILHPSDRTARRS